MNKETEASLIVNGKEHFGWTEVGITRSLEQLATTFELGFTERWSDEGKPNPIREGDECTVKLGNDTVISGYVDEMQIDYDANDHQLRVVGRSYTGDLCDCSAIHKKGQWKKQDLQQIAEAVCAPFDIPVNVETSIGDKFSSFAIQDGETAFEALDRASRMRGVILTTNAKGELVLTDIGAKSTDTVIEFGVNALRGSYVGNWKERHSRIIVKGDAPGDDDTYGKAVSQAFAQVEDDVLVNAGRYRPLIVHSEHHETSGKLKTRAVWERNIRAGRGQRLKYVVDGWRDNSGALWEPNTLVRIKDERFRCDMTLLLVSVRYTKNLVDGTNAELEFADQITMTSEPLKVKTKGDPKDMYNSSKQKK
jgi:prophage tail gpP-like protein